MAETSSSSWDKGGHAGANEPSAAHGVKDRAHEEAAALATKAKEAASCAVGKTSDVASSVAQNVRNMASTIGHRAEETVGTVGGGMKSLAGTIRENAPEGGVFGGAASGVASGLESGGAYLQDHNLHGMAADLTGLVRRYPFQAILLGIGAGFLLGRATRSLTHGQ
jgi:hypothetical protein